jgi:hypothetical protein
VNRLQNALEIHHNISGIKSGVGSQSTRTYQNFGNSDLVAITTQTVPSEPL